MYLGAEEAIGNPAEAILSFKGLNDYKLHKLTGEPIGCGNERYLTNYKNVFRKIQGLQPCI